MSATRTSRRKFQCVIDRKVKGDGKPWLRVKFIDGRGDWVPSFADLARIAGALIFCEREKYPRLRHRPSRLFLTFLRDAVELADRALDEKWRGEQFDAALDRLCHRVFAVPYRAPEDSGELTADQERMWLP